MTQAFEMQPFDDKVRRCICSIFVQTCRPPSVEELSTRLATPANEIQATLERLHESHGVVLDDQTRTLLMASPFSCVPTPFQVEAGGRSWWANCIWDALGILALVKQNGQVVASCGCCNAAMTLTVRDGALTSSSGTVHFAVPARSWWKNIVFT
jgi:hypothetical protein